MGGIAAVNKVKGNPIICDKRKQSTWSWEREERLIPSGARELLNAIIALSQGARKVVYSLFKVKIREAEAIETISEIMEN